MAIAANRIRTDLITPLGAYARGPKRDAVVFNAGAALLVADVARDVREGILLAAEAIDSGAAAERLAALISFSEPATAEAS